VRPLIRLALTIVLLGACGDVFGGDSRSVSVTVKVDGKSCVVRHYEASCSDLAGVLAHDLGIANDVAVRVSPEGCGDGAIARASTVARLLGTAGFTKVVVVGSITEPNRKCAP
jgi:hypothetical protein